MSKHELAAELQRCESELRQAQARYHAVLAEMSSRGTMAEYGYGSAEALQVDLLSISRREAARRCARAGALHASVGSSGASIPPLAAAASAAFADGSIGIEHVDAIVACLVEVPADDVAEVERVLAELAQRAEPYQVLRAGRHAVDLLRPDGPEPADEILAAPEREFYLQKRRDGRYGLTGILDDESGHALELLLSPLAKPRPAEDGRRDPRRPEQRRGDAFACLIEQVQRAVERPTEGGERPTVVVTMRLEDLMIDGHTRIEGGSPVLSDGTPITVEQARRIACDAQVIPAVLGGEGELLDLGRAERVATAAQRRALRLRDRGCVKCGRPERWCHAHHVLPWSQGGTTDVGNMCLLCSECHRLVHHAGWTVTMLDGRPECHPPEWIRHRQWQAAA